MKVKPLLAVTLALVALGSSSHAAVIAQSFDFGSDPGKDGDGGFTLTPVTTPTTPWSVAKDSLKYTRSNDPGTGNQNASALKEFTSLQGEDFTITSDATLTAKAGGGTSNNDRFGLVLFAGANNSTTAGISLQLRDINRTIIAGPPQSQGPYISIFTGVSSLNEYWLGSVAAGTNYTFTADVVYTIDGLNFDVTFTLSDGTTTQDLTQTFLAADYTGDFYGFGSRAITGNIFDYDTFDIAPVPEPTTVAMLLGGLGLLALRRRR